jgi:hypothetical protein
VAAGPAEHVAARLQQYVAAGARHIVVRIATTSLITQRAQLEQIIRLRSALTTDDADRQPVAG